MGGKGGTAREVETEGLLDHASRMAGLVASLNPIDDAMFRAVAEDSGAVQEIVRTALGDDGLVVVQTVPQRVLGIPGARLVAVDVLCETAGGDLVAVEVQKRKEEDPPRRMRYVRACSEAWAVRRGTEFAEVPRVATVYISRADPFGDGLPLYHVDRVVRETGRRVDDGAVDVYANVASARGGSALERLLRYMARSEGELEGFPALSARVQYFKETPKGRAEMNELIEEYAREMADEAKAEGKAEGGAEMLLASLKNLMANLGLAADAAMDALGVPEGERAGYRAKLV